MVIRAFFIGIGLGLGSWLLLRGYFAPVASLSEQLRNFSDENRTTRRITSRGSSIIDRISLQVLELVSGEELDDLRADVEVAGLDMQQHAKDKLQAAVGGGLLAAVVPFMLGWVSSAFVVLVLALIGGVGAYFLPDVDVRKKAEERREEFSEALTAYVTLSAVSISGGGGLQTALRDAVGVGTGWPFELLRNALVEAALQNTSPWVAFDELGRRLKLIPLIELAGALGLAGSGGAALTETLKARADAGQARLLSEAKAAAEKKSASLGLPVGAMLLGWVGFLAYPAITNLLAS